MPTARHADVEVYYQTAGSGETVVFVGDVGFGAWQWAWQHPAVAGPFEALTFDHRGIGRSDSPAGPYALSTLAGDVEAVLADVGARRAHVVGAGLGGRVGLHLAHETGRVRSLTLLGSGTGEGAAPMAACTGTDTDAPTDTDTDDDADDTLATLLSASFRDSYSDEVRKIAAWRAEEDAPREVWEAQAAAVDDALPPLYEVTVPTLVVHGDADAVWPADAARRLTEGLPRGTFVDYEAGHLVGVERSGAVNDRLVGFLEGIGE